MRVGGIAVLTLGLLAWPAARAQEGVLRPEESAAKARELLQQTSAALGGAAFLRVRDISCTGRFAQFSSAGDLSGYIRFWDFTLLPDKSRTEFSNRRNIIFVVNGDEGWELDRGGVQESAAELVQRAGEEPYKDFTHLLRYRMDEEGLTFRYAGQDIVDLREVDWIEVVDRERRTLRIAIQRANHLPLRSVYIARDRATRQRTEEVYYYSNYHKLQGVETPLQLARERNGRKVYQVFYQSCEYNTGLQESFFTREALEQRWGQLNKGKRKK